MSGFFEILDKIKQKPGMYLGRASIKDLFMFLVGYKMARLELQIEPTEKELEFHREFQPWIQKRFQVQSVNSWANIILLYSVDEKEAFYYFFKLLEEFLNRDRTLKTDEVNTKSTTLVTNSFNTGEKNNAAANASFEIELDPQIPRKEVIVSE